jgi:hypothetical protein
MRLFFVYIFYYMGDIISRTTMQWLNGFGYGLYSKLMLWSSDLDINDILWKPARNKKR